MRSAEPRLAADLAWCHLVLGRGSKSFAAAGRLLPADLRDAFAAFYAFCRSADDAVDSGTADAGTLATLHARVDRLMRGTGPFVPGDYALSRMIARYGLPRGVFDALLDGFAWELEARRYETLADVTAYAARVAATVGAAACVFMGRRDRASLARACDLGVAMQLTNIARDVGEDARAGRLYLPRAWMREEGLDPDIWLAAPAFSPALGRVVYRLLEAADTLYRRADAGIDHLPESCRPAMRAARLIYADIGRVIAANGYDVVTRRAATSTARKAWLLLRALASPAGSPGLLFPPLPETRFLVALATTTVHVPMPPRVTAPRPLVPRAAGVV